MVGQREWSHLIKDTFMTGHFVLSKHYFLPYTKVFPLFASFGMSFHGIILTFMSAMDSIFACSCDFS